MLRVLSEAGRIAAIAFLLAGCYCHAADTSLAPTVEKLKPLYLETDIVKDGRPVAVIVTPGSGCHDQLAKRIAQAAKGLTGAAPAIVADDAPAAAVPLKGNVIVLGNRSTNRLIGKLYDRYYTLLDLKYPGKGGYVVRTLHNPFGGGINAVLAGGSDPAGIEKAVEVLIGKLKEASSGGSIRLGRLAEIRLGDGLKVPSDIREAKIWEASAGYKSVGYFGWNSISKRMALYYMTGDPVHAKEFLRLAFPDEQALKEIAEIDGERIEGKEHPLSGPYHYNAHMMILFWDLIEESPVFSDADRLRVTRAFAEQINHWAAEWAYAARSTKPPKAVGSRHGQWAAVSLYCLSRYFQNYYPNPLWKRCLESSRNHFASLHNYAWVSGETDNLFWYNTAIAPILTYMVLTGDRVPLDNGVLGTLLRGQEILISGLTPDGALTSASMGMLNKAAYLTRDGRWITYRRRTGVDTDVFRLGQSFWPEEDIKPKMPDDLVGRWTIDWLSKPKWAARRNGLPLAQSFNFGSFRSRPDVFEQTGGGDFILIDGFNGASRNPYHTFAILELRLAGYTLLKGYLNQVITRVDGLMEPEIAMNAALRRRDVLGETAFAVGEVPNAPFANWRRTVLDRVGHHALVIDELTFREDGPNTEVRFEWQTTGGGKRLADGQVAFVARRQDGKRGWEKGGQICVCDPIETSGRGARWTMCWRGSVKKGERKTFYSLIGMKPGAEKPTMECHRTGPDAAALALPEAATAATHLDGQTKAELAIQSADYLFAMTATKIASLLEASRPIDLDWDLRQGVLHLNTPEKVAIDLLLAPSASPTLNGKAATSTHFELTAGRHVIQGAVPRTEAIAEFESDLKSQLDKGRAARAKTIAAKARTEEPAVGELKLRMTAQFDSAIVDIEVLPGGGGNPLLAVAQDKSIHLLSLDGKEQSTLATDGPIRMIHWWPEPKLLLAGSTDEKVIAFDVSSGKRRWVFVSEMDPAVFRAAKTYWFKTAPGHEGIHGLDTGPFIDGKSQAFVGSACTLEILDQHGKLVKRLPHFWGPGSTFALIDGPGGTKNLLAARKYNGTNTVAIINNKVLDARPRGFITVPAGHTYMPGWSSMNRHHLFHEDLDGDGTREVISEINGTWNRVCVWSADGKPLYAANFGPGPRIPKRTMRDLDVCDLDGDGKKEIVTATSSHLVVALDSKCNKLWTAYLTSPANVLACIHPKGQKKSQIVLGCDDGGVRILDADGKLARKGTVAGRPDCIQRLTDANGNQLVAIGTHKGGLSVFEVGP